MTTTPHSDLTTPATLCDVPAQGARGWLADLRVLCRGSSVPLRTASGVLRELGCHVDYGAEPTEVGRPGAYDIVLVDRITGSTLMPAQQYLEVVARANTSVWVTASAYGLQGRRADAPGSELVTLASGGVLGHSRSGESGVPVLPAGHIGSKLVGVALAAAGLHGVHLVREKGSPVHVDVSAQAVAIACGLSLEMAHALAHCPDQGGSARYGAPNGVFACSDGHIYIVVLEQHQWEALRSCLDPAFADVPTIEDARQRSDDVNAVMSAWAAGRSSTDCESALQEAGVPCTAVNTVSAFVARAKRAGRPLHDGRALDLPAVVTEVSHVNEVDEAPRKSLHDLRVLDAGHVLAVPLAAAWLGAMGAKVTKLEDPERLDVYRRRGPFAAGEPGVNRSAYFNAVNYCKRSLDVRVGSEGSSLDITPYDVIIQNLTPRRALAVGVAGADVLAIPGARLSITSSGFGTTGEWANYRAYGHNIHAFAGLVAATRDVDGNMADVGTPWSDPLTGVVIVTWTLAWALSGQRDTSTALDLSMAEIMAAHLADLADDGARDYYRPGDVGGDFFVQCGGDGGDVAVTLANDADVARFEAVTDVPFCAPSARAVRLPPSALGVLADLDAFEAADRLRARGLAAAAVQTAEDLREDAFLHSTGLFQTVTSPTLGTYEVTGLPWVIVGAQRAPLTAAPERLIDVADKT